MELGDLSISEAPTFRAQREQFVAKIMEAAVLAFPVTPGTKAIKPWTSAEALSIINQIWHARKKYDQVRERHLAMVVAQAFWAWRGQSNSNSNNMSNNSSSRIVGRVRGPHPQADMSKARAARQQGEWFQAEVEEVRVLLAGLRRKQKGVSKCDYEGYLFKLSKEAEAAYESNNMKQVWEVEKLQFKGKVKAAADGLADAQGIMRTAPAEKAAIWDEHFWYQVACSKSGSYSHWTLLQAFPQNQSGAKADAPQLRALRRAI